MIEDIDLINHGIIFPVFIEFKDKSVSCFRENGMTFTAVPKTGLMYKLRDLYNDDEKKKYLIEIKNFTLGLHKQISIYDFDKVCNETGEMLMQKIKEIAIDFKNNEQIHNEVPF